MWSCTYYLTLRCLINMGSHTTGKAGFSSLFTVTVYIYNASCHTVCVYTWALTSSFLLCSILSAILYKKLRLMLSKNSRWAFDYGWDCYGQFGRKELKLRGTVRAKSGKAQQLRDEKQRRICQKRRRKAVEGWQGEPEGAAWKEEDGKQKRSKILTSLFIRI